MRNALTMVLLLALPVAAQDDKQAPKPDATKRLEALEKEVQEAITVWRAEMTKKAEEAKKARAEGRKIPAMRMRPDLGPLVGKFIAAADDYAGTDDAVPFLIWAVTNGAMFDKDAAKTAVATLTKSHSSSPAIKDLVPMMGRLPRMVGEEAASDLTAAIKKNNKDKNVLGWLALTKYKETIEEADKDSADYKSARGILLASAKKADDQGLVREIRAVIDLREKLGVGGVAPDIAGVDLDGVEFKLSDYKGKVIFLDFWGDW